MQNIEEQNQKRQKMRMESGKNMNNNIISQNNNNFNNQNNALGEIFRYFYSFLKYFFVNYF